MNEEKGAVKSSKGGVLYFLAGFVVMLFAGWVIFPALLYSSKPQPVSFSHVKHIEAEGLECEACHAFRDDGTFMGTANMTGDMEGACLNCHDNPDEMKGIDPREREFLDNYVAKGVNHIEWLVYSRQPDNVFFPHSIHVTKAEVECQRCHGPMEEQDEPPAFQVNRITGYSRDIWGRNISGLNKNPWDSMKMGDCGDCHEERGTSNACFVCHK